MQEVELGVTTRAARVGVTVNMDRLKLAGTISEPGPNRPVYFRPDGSQFTW